MKTRNGFVSNSSSTSFIAIGYKINEQQARQFLSDEMRLDVPDDHESIMEILEKIERSRDFPIKMIGEAGIVLGKVFRVDSDSGLEDKENSIEIEKLVEKIKLNGAVLGLGNPTIFTGTYQN